MDIDLLVESDGLYMTTLPEGQSFMWRLLSLKEYRVFSVLRARGVFPTLLLYDKVFNRCFVGESLAINGDLPAGIFLSIGELIMYLSGDCAGEERAEIEAVRASYHQVGVHEVMKRIVLMAFPYKPDELESWTRAKLTRMFVEAEALLQNKGEYQPLDTSKIMTAKEAAIQQNKPVVDFRKENREIGDEFGDRKHALDRHPAELADKARRTKQLKAHQLRQVDASMQDEAKQKRKYRRS